MPIDLRQNDWTIAYNVMRPRAVADPSVLISNFVQAMSYVWGADGIQNTPLFGRLAKEVLWPVYEKKMTLNEVKYLIDRTNKRIRTELTEGLTKDSATSGWEFSNNLSPKDFNTQFSSTVNRFYNFLDTEKLRLMFGQNGASLDLGKAIEDGQIIIANLSTEGARVSEEDASLFATLLLSDLWTAAKERLQTYVAQRTLCNSVRVLVGCAPCQPFSKYTQGLNTKADAKWSLLRSFGRLVDEIRPDIVSMENVPQLQKHSIFTEFVETLKKLGYHVSHSVVFCPDYGVPQHRNRLVLFASKFGAIEIVKPTRKKYPTVKTAIGRLHNVLCAT